MSNDLNDGVQQGKGCRVMEVRRTKVTGLYKGKAVE